MADAPALIRKTLTIGHRTSTLRKDVQPVVPSAVPFALRHEYRFKRDR